MTVGQKTKTTQTTFTDVFKKDAATPMFQESSQHTAAGGAFCIECDEMIEKMFSSGINRGHRIREIAQVLLSSVSLVEARKSMEFSEMYNRTARYLDEEIRRKARIKSKKSEENSDWKDRDEMMRGDQGRPGDD